MFLQFLLKTFLYFCQLYQTLFPSIIQVEKVNLNIKVPKNLKNLKFIQISDLHFDGRKDVIFERLPMKLMNEMIEIINKEDVDLIFITGDFLQRHLDNLEDLMKELKKLKSKMGIYGCLGNHDYYRDHLLLRNTLQKNGIRILLNEISHDVENLEIVGLHDYNFHGFKEYKELDLKDNDKIRIILSHNPNSIWDFRDSNVNYHLTLSGHSHGGQICLIFFFNY
jgi:uncharacterized protein